MVATVNSKALEVVEMAVTEKVAKMKVEALDSPSAILCILRATAPGGRSILHQHLQ